MAERVFELWWWPGADGRRRLWSGEQFCSVPLLPEEGEAQALFSFFFACPYVALETRQHHLDEPHPVGLRGYSHVDRSGDFGSSSHVLIYGNDAHACLIR